MDHDEPFSGLTSSLGHHRLNIVCVCVCVCVCVRARARHTHCQAEIHTQTETRLGMILSFNLVTVWKTDVAVY